MLTNYQAFQIAFSLRCVSLKGILSLCVLLLVASSGNTAEEPNDDAALLDAARESYQRGRYAEALDAFEELQAETGLKSTAIVWRSRVQRSIGQWTDATKTLQEAVKSDSENAGLQAELALCLFEQGQFDAAAAAVLAALKKNPRELRAMWVQSELLRESGKLKEAAEAYRTFVRYYNAEQPEDAESLMWVARGSAQYARWNSVSQIFKFIINTLCPDALKADKNHWQARYFAGQLLLEKFNRAQAIPELKKALAINPSAAEVYVALGEAARQQFQWEEAEKQADEALKINSKLPSALRLKADVLLSDGQFSKAIELLTTALEVNPKDQETLGMIAAAHLLSDLKTLDDRKSAAYQQLQELITNIDAIENIEIEKPCKAAGFIIQAADGNPAPGIFLTVVGERLASRKKFQAAELMYRRAIDVMPQLALPKTSLGMLFMQTGRTEDATNLLEKAFEADPFHVRVSNMRKVLKVLANYHVINTDHFSIHVDSQSDRLLGEYMAEYLEEQYDDLVKQFGYEPKQRTHFEIYHRGKGLSAHKWFSARMVGLPWIQTIGASTGVIVALASPTATSPPYNWARVLKHEYVHVITLQQTHFNIPHWFTEALAVTSEGYERPQIWNELLATRVPQGRIRGLDDLTQGFVRPESPNDWQFAYCQSRLCAQYMIEKYGEKTIAQMLDCYRRGLSTRQAIKEVYKVDQDEFEAGYIKFMEDIVAELKGINVRPRKKPSEIEKAYRDNPEDATKAGEFAYLRHLQKRRREARELAEEALEKNPKEPLANVVMARLEILGRDVISAIGYLNKAYDREKPHPAVLDLLGQVYVYIKDYKNAQEVYELGREHFPNDLKWLKGAVLVYLRTDQLDKLESSLKVLIARDADHASGRKKLAEISLNRDEFQAAVDYAQDAIYIDVNDAETHHIFGDALAGLKNYKKSIRELKVALQLAEEGKPGIQLSLAKTLAANGDKDDARALVESLQKNDDTKEAASKLLEQLNGAK